MPYKNRFSFKKSISFKYIMRGFEYLDRIHDFSIDGNIVHAKICGTKEYDVSFAIDFEKRNISFATCSCPYINEHHTCKHIVALMLYVDLYINGASLDDLCAHHLASFIAENLKIMNKKMKIVRLEDLEKITIGKNIFYTNIRFNYASHSFLPLENVSQSMFIYAIDILKKYDVIQTDNKGVVWSNVRLLKNYKNQYLPFYSKYSLLMGYGDYVYDYFHENKYYDENEEYYYSKEIKEKEKGIDLIGYYSFFRNDDLKNFTFLYDEKINDFIFDDEISFGSGRIIPVERYDLSNSFIEFFISSVNDEDDKEYYLNEYEKGNFSKQILSTKDRAKFSKLQKNYYIGKGVEFCLKNKIDFWFKDFATFY